MCLVDNKTIMNFQALLKKRKLEHFQSYSSGQIKNYERKE